MTDADREKCEQIIMTAFGLMRMQGPPPTDEELTDASLAERKQMVAETLEKVVDVVGMERALREIDHELVCKAFMRGYGFAQEGRELMTGNNSYITGLLMGLSGGRMNPNEIARILTEMRVKPDKGDG